MTGYTKKNLKADVENVAPKFVKVFPEDYRRALNEVLPEIERASADDDGAMGHGFPGSAPGLLDGSALAAGDLR